MILGEIARLLSAPGTSTHDVDPWADAACRDFDPALGLWDEANLDLAAPELAVAVPVCLACPLRQACEDIAAEAESADAQGGSHGVWGGRSPRQRHAGVSVRWPHSVRGSGTERGCSSPGCTETTWAGKKTPWCSTHLAQVRGWTLTHPSDLDPVLWERAAIRRATTEGRPAYARTTWSQRRSADRAARRQAAASIPGQRRAADDLAQEPR